MAIDGLMRNLVFSKAIVNNNLQLGNIRQPYPPPVLAQVQTEVRPIYPTRFADPRHGPVKFSEDGQPGSNSYQDLHITHPTQTCFMSSANLHTHYSHQVMLPEAVAIVKAPTDKSSLHGIFHLSDPGGLSAIRNCQQHGFHPHGEPEYGTPIYEHCSRVYMNANLKFDVVDLRL